MSPLRKLCYFILIKSSRKETPTFEETVGFLLLSISFIHNPDFPACEFMNWWKQQYISLVFEGAECPYKLLSVNKEPNYQCLNVLPVRIPSDRVLLLCWFHTSDSITLLTEYYYYYYVTHVQQVYNRDSFGFI